ncbi:MAG: response regulator [Arenimonas sp.]
MRMKQASVLIVDDNAEFATLLKRYLEREHYHVHVCGDGAEAETAILGLGCDAVILDARLPNKDGFAICQAVRMRYQGVIMMLTGLDDDTDRILGLELGADEYLTKPVAPAVVVAHLRAHLRRAQGGEKSTASRLQALRFGGLHIDPAARRATLDGEVLPLTSAEFDALWHLAANAGRPVSRDMLFELQRGIRHDGIDRSIDMLIVRLRKRLGGAELASQRIKTVRGKGYLFNPDAW